MLFHSTAYCAHISFSLNWELLVYFTEPLSTSLMEFDIYETNVDSLLKVEFKMCYLVQTGFNAWLFTSSNSPQLGQANEILVWPICRQTRLNLFQWSWSEEKPVSSLFTMASLALPMH